MMNNKDKLDDLFRNSLDGYRVEPSAGLWKKIESRFFPSSGMRRIVVIMTILAILLAGSALVTWWALSGHPEKIEDTASTPAPDPVAVPEITSHLDKKTSEKNKNTSYPDNEDIQASSQDVEMTSHEQVAENITLEDPGKKSAQAPVTNGLPHDPEITAENEIKSTFPSVYSMGRRTGLIYHPWQLDPESMTARFLSANIPISKTLKNEYARKYEIHAGAFFMPSVLFYDPNPSNTGWSAGMNVQYSRSRVNVYAGIGVSRFRDKGSWQVQYQTYDSVGYFMNVTSFRVNPDQPGKVIFETSQETVYDSVPHVNIEEKTNVYTYVDIPVGIGLEVVKSKRFSLTVKTGLKLSLLAGSDEPTVNVSIPAASEIDITREVPARRGATWRYTAGLEASYLITGRLNMYIEPAFEQYLNSVYTSMGEYQAKKPYLIGVNIGARYWIK